MNYIRELEAEKAHSDTMKAAALHWMRQAQELERTIAAIVKASGGEVVVPRDDLHELPDMILSHEERLHDMTHVFRVRRKPAATEEPR